MTLERHRSHLIPDVSYSLDGTIFVTDTGGTFPLRGKGKQHQDIRDHGYLSPEPAPSFRSYDPRRDQGGPKRKYKQRPSQNRMADEVRNMSGYSTISTHTSSSLGRRLRRSKRKYSSVRGPEYRKSKDSNGNFRFNENGYGSMSAGSEGRRLRAGTPRMTPEFAETIRIQNEERASRRAKRSSRPETPYDIKRRNSLENKKIRHVHRDSNGSLKSHKSKERLRKIHDEKLPFAVFLVDGVFLVVIGIIRILMSYWHEYFCPLWAGLFAIFLGVIGAKHQGLYLAKGISAAYVLFAFLVSIAMMASSGLVLKVLVPTLTLLANNFQAFDVIDQVKFTNMNKTLTNIDLSSTAVVWTSMVLDLSTVIFIFMGFFSITAAMIGLGNHWDAAYDTTADCDHRGNPRLFNPIEQSALGEATVFMGLLYIAAEEGFVHVSHNHFYLPVIAGGLVIVSGILSFCFGKRTDMLSLGTFACFLEILSFAACCGSIILMTLAIVSDVTDLQKLSNTGSQYTELLAFSIIGGAVVFILAVNIIFVVGTIFRLFRQVCCHNCCDEGGKHTEEDPYDSYVSYDRRSEKFDSLARRDRRR